MSVRPITVAVNTLSVSAANEGTRTVLCRLLPALERVAPEIRQVLVCSPENRGLFDTGAEVIEVSLDHDSALRRIAADQHTVPRAVRGRADVLLTPSSVGSFRSPIPQVVVFQHHLALPSCQALAGPQTVSRLHRAYYGPVLRWSLRRADAVLADSQFLADGLVQELGIPASKVAPMVLGVDPPPPGANRSRDPLVLFVGTLYEYKGADVAVQAFALALEHLPAGASLVVVGRDPDGQQIPMLEALADRLGIRGQVEITGPVSDDALTDLYRRAGVFVLPSRCEGFGLPVLEAMSHGTPVVVADSTSLREVAADAGIRVEPDDVDGFASALRSVLGDRAVAADLSTRGLARATELSWDATAVHLQRALHAVGE